MKNEAHIICCNEGMEYIILDNRVKARTTLDELKKQAYITYSEECPNTEDKALNLKEYSKQYYWHLHTVPYENGTILTNLEDKK